MAMSARGIVGLAVGAFLFAILWPIAMDEITGANTTAWETPVATMFESVFPILVIVGVAIAYVKSR